MKDAIYCLSTSGYIFLPGAVDRPILASLQCAIDRMLAEDDATCGVHELEAMGQRGALRNLCDHSPPFQALLADSPVYPILDTLLAPGYILHSYDGLVLYPGDGRFPWDFHTDLLPLVGVAFPANQIPGINCLYYLDNTTPENGATWLVPASHRSFITKPQSEEMAQFAIQVVGKAGAVLLFDARLWHCAGNNQSNTSRRLIKTLFVSPWLRPQMDYPRAIRPDVLERLNPRAREVIGRPPHRRVCKNYGRCLDKV